MNNILKFVVIGIGVAAISASIYRIIDGGEFSVSYGGILIGSVIIGVAVFESSKKKKKKTSN